MSGTKKITFKGIITGYKDYKLPDYLGEFPPLRVVEIEHNEEDKADKVIDFVEDHNKESAKPFKITIEIIDEKKY